VLSEAAGVYSACWLHRRLAACCARAAVSDAGEWLSQRRVAGAVCTIAAAFREDLKDAGYVVGANVAIEFCLAEEVFLTARVA